MNMRKKTAGLRAVILARVSSEEQAREGYSIDGQLERLRTFAASDGLRVVREIVEVGSASRFAQGPRDEYRELVGILKRGEAEVVVAAKVDRATRNQKDEAELWELARDYGAEVRFADGLPTIRKDASPNDRLILRVMGAFAEHYSEDLSQNVKGGLRKKRLAGGWCHVAPIGYLNTRIQSRAVLVLDPIRAPLVRQLLQEYDQGIHSVSTLHERAAGIGLTNRTGGRVCRSAIADMLRQRVYAGLIEAEGSIIRAEWPPLIDEATWHRIQDRIGTQRDCHLGAARRTFRLGQLFWCETCGCRMVGELKRNRPKGHPACREFTYYRCSGARGDCPRPYIREDRLEDLVAEKLGGLQIAPAMLEALRLGARDYFRAQVGDAGRDVVRLEAEEKKLAAKLVRAAEARIGGEQTEELGILESRWREERTIVRRALDTAKREPEDLSQALIGLVDLCAGAKGVLPRLDAKACQQVLQWMMKRAAWGPNGVEVVWSEGVEAVMHRTRSDRLLEWTAAGLPLRLVRFLEGAAPNPVAASQDAGLGAPSGDGSAVADHVPRPPHLGRIPNFAWLRPIPPHIERVVELIRAA